MGSIPGTVVVDGQWIQHSVVQHPVVNDDFVTSQTNKQSFASQQQSATMPAKQSTLMTDGRLEMGSGLLTVTTRARSPSTLTAPLSTGSGRSISPSDMTLRARLQSRLDTRSPGLATMTGGRVSPSVYFGQSRTGSLNSLNDGGEILQHSPRFVRDTSKYWHKPYITREEAIVLLRDKPPGSFVIRNSNTFQGAFGLALKVAQLPPNVQMKEGVGDPQSELVRHFLIEPTSKGVRLKGCSNEPVFASLAALVYQHTITPLALPCKLLLPEFDIAGADAVDSSITGTTSKSLLYVQGAACNVLYINSIDMESLTGPEALSRAIAASFPSTGSPPYATDVHFKVSAEGITLTDNKHRLFFRRHYPINTITFCGIDAKDRRWTLKFDDNLTMDCKVFGFVARKPGSLTDNACHVFAEMDQNQPANAIVNFLTKVMIGQGQFMKT
jgi:tensin